MDVTLTSPVSAGLAMSRTPGYSAAKRVALGLGLPPKRGQTDGPFPWVTEHS